MLVVVVVGAGLLLVAGALLGVLGLRAVRAGSALAAELRGSADRLVAGVERARAGAPPRPGRRLDTVRSPGGA